MIKSNTILFIDNDYSSYQLLFEILDASYIELIYIDCVKKVTDYIKNNAAISLVITELRLLDGSGIEILRKVRGVDKNIPVMLQTATVNISSEEDYINAGFSAYVSKPVDLESFKNKILAFLD